VSNRICATSWQDRPDHDANYVHGLAHLNQNEPFTTAKWIDIERRDHSAHRTCAAVGVAEHVRSSGVMTWVVVGLAQVQSHVHAKAAPLFSATNLSPTYAADYLGVHVIKVLSMTYFHGFKIIMVYQNVL
jgi:hypothetical protein